MSRVRAGWHHRQHTDGTTTTFAVVNGSIVFARLHLTAIGQDWRKVGWFREWLAYDLDVLAPLLERV